LLENRDLQGNEAQTAMNEIMSGEATPAQVAAFLVGLKKKGETVGEITALASAMRGFSRTIHPKVNGYLLDTCGTGGDRTKTFNVSTTSAIVIAAAGVPVAKHGNRSSTSRCGSADVLERLGLNLNMTPEAVQNSIENIGIGFMFAPNFHSAMKNVASIRKELGIRTVFNILGPLTNPAGATAQLIGVYDPNLLEPMAQSAHNLGVSSVMTVYGLDGVDEISMSERTAIVKIQNGSSTREEIDPTELGFKMAHPRDVAGYDVDQNAKLTIDILSGSLSKDDPRLQMVLANSAAGLLLCAAARDMREGIEIAANTVSDGKANKKLHELVTHSGGEFRNPCTMS